MKNILLATALIFALSGCSSIKGTQFPLVSRYEAGRKLSSAVSEMERGRHSAAITLFEEIIAEPGIKGVTDEALFRVSLLKLLYDERDGGVSSLRYLEMLRSYFPDSSWTQQSRPLYEFVKGGTEVRRQNRNLKLLNMSLTRDNKEMRENMDRLKSLDLKLERKGQ